WSAFVRARTRRITSVAASTPTAGSHASPTPPSLSIIVDATTVARTWRTRVRLARALTGVILWINARRRGHRTTDPLSYRSRPGAGAGTGIAESSRPPRHPRKSPARRSPGHARRAGQGPLQAPALH